MSGIPKNIICIVRGTPPDYYEHIMIEEIERISQGAFGVVYSCKIYKRITNEPIIYKSINNQIPDANDVIMKDDNTPLSKLEFKSNCELGESVAIKKVLQDERYKNRELQILRTLKHPNIIPLKYFFKQKQKEGNYLFLIFPYFPLTISKFTRECIPNGGPKPPCLKAIMYQIIKGLDYIHSMNICHRDIKPHNILYDPPKCLVQIADFGSAKQLIIGQKSVSYICSRHYRAPELIFGLSTYTCSIDIWSTGCVMAEMILGKPIFPGDSNVGQLSEIIRIIGNPSVDDLKNINPDYKPIQNRYLKPITLKQLIPEEKWISAISLLKEMFVYNPFKRITSSDMIKHSYFDDVNEKDAFGHLSGIC